MVPYHIHRISQASCPGNDALPIARNSSIACVIPYVHSFYIHASFSPTKAQRKGSKKTTNKNAYKLQPSKYNIEGAERKWKGIGKNKTLYIPGDPN